MQEDFLHYLWESGNFDQTKLQTTQGEEVSLINRGKKNTNAGADFQEAHLLIGGLEWAGDVEIHILASDWQKHEHTKNPAYNAVILHVVWKADKEVFRQDGSTLPTIELSGRASLDLLAKYTEFIDNQSIIPCQSHWGHLDRATKFATITQALEQRLARKSELIIQLLAECGQSWDETAYRLLVQNFGFKVNNEAFASLSAAVPQRLIQLHSDQLFQLEALLFGQSGLLTLYSETDAYVMALGKEYDFLAHKYQLKIKQLEAHRWKFLRTHPANFPTLRLGQLAAFLHRYPKFFSLLIHEKSEDLSRIFDITPSQYWQEHYVFGKESPKKIGNLGDDSALLLLINVVVPLLSAYGQVKSLPAFRQKALYLLEQLDAENNHITKKWQKIGFSAHSAYDSQAVIELFNQFCNPKKCLSCPIGQKILT